MKRRPPRLVRPHHRWSRPEVLEWLLDEMAAATLVGLDLGIALPFADCGAYFPGWAGSPPDAQALWALVDAACADDPHIGVASFVDHAEASRYFRLTAGRGSAIPPRDATTPWAAFADQRSRSGRLQSIQQLQPRRASASRQVELSGMRVLHRLCRATARMDGRSLPTAGSVVVETTPRSGRSTPVGRLQTADAH